MTTFFFTYTGVLTSSVCVLSTVTRRSGTYGYQDRHPALVAELMVQPPVLQLFAVRQRYKV